MTQEGSPATTSGTADSVPDVPRDGAWRTAYLGVALLFIAFPIVNVLSTGGDPVEIVLVALGTAVFGAILFFDTRIPDAAPGQVRVGPRTGMSEAEVRRRIAVSAAGVVLLLVIAAAISVRRPEAGWIAFFYYASTAASTIWSGRVAVALIIASGVTAGIAMLVTESDLAGALVQGLSVSVIGFTVYSAIAVRRTNRALVQARTELARLAVSDERARIARDLHDTLGHSLSVIALKSELAGRLVDDDPSRARSEMDDVQRVARESLAAVRETIGGYRQASLATELAGARSALAAAGIESRVEPAPDGLPPAVDAILAWAVREGVTNILRHGRAATAEIRVGTERSEAAVEIVNDRRGPTPDGAVGPAIATTSGSGLAGLRERVATVGGGVEAGRLPDGGFRLRVSVPLP
jgi:two-component system sensor histidine kinase DesK